MSETIKAGALEFTEEQIEQAMYPEVVRLFVAANSDQPVIRGAYPSEMPKKVEVVATSQT